MKTQNEARLNALLDKYYAKTITRDEARELKQCLKNDPECKTLFENRKKAERIGDLMAKYTAKKINRRELKELKKWLSEDPKHGDLYEDLTNISVIELYQKVKFNYPKNPPS